MNTAATKSVTYDEIKHVFMGVLYWEGDNLYSVVQNPPLVNAIIGVPVSLGFDPQFPIPIQFDSNWLKVSQAFMWELNENGLEMLWAGRLGIMLVSVLLGALVYRWAGQLFSSTRAGLLALILYTFDPNILAHSFLSTTDIGLAFFLTWAAYLVWRHWRDSGQATLLIYLVAGLAIGTALAAKFSGLIILPALLLIAGYRWITSRAHAGRWSKLMSKQPARLSLFRTIVEVSGWILIAGLVFLLIYRFDFEILKLDFTLQREHQLNGHSAYFWGELGNDGWPLYFPITFAIKTPIPVLLLLLFSLLLLIFRRHLDWERLWPLIIVAGFFMAGILSRVNIGYRYLLPVLPLLYVVVAQLGQPGYLTSRSARSAVAAALALTIFVSLWAHPHYLAYFNQLVGGPDKGWKYLADSNIDWGQDLQALS
ncbi:MAG: glycosyltransferase family 39 protein, partial [Chloroflexota bacterium]